MKLNVKAFALSLGILTGLVVFFITGLFLVVGHEGYTLIKLYKIMPGYGICWKGAFFGLLSGFVYGAVGGAIFSCLYNRLNKEK